MTTIERTYTTREAADLAGISYRMLDHFLRTGAVRVDEPTPGSGHPRQMSEAEVRALIEVVSLYRSAQTIVRDFTSGVLWELALRKESDGPGLERERDRRPRSPDGQGLRRDRTGS